jgi:hypothetical protein
MSFRSWINSARKGGRGTRPVARNSSGASPPGLIQEAFMKHLVQRLLDIVRCLGTRRHSQGTSVQRHWWGEDRDGGSPQFESSGLYDTIPFL